MEKIKKIFNRKTYPFIILFLAMCIITLIKPLDFGDDVAFANVLVKGTEQYSGTSNIFEYLGISKDDMDAIIYQEIKVSQKKI